MIVITYQENLKTLLRNTMNSNVQDLEKNLISALEDSKAEDILSLDVSHLTSITDKMMICTGTSSRHRRAIAEHAITKAKKIPWQPLGVEGGEESAEWILIDFGPLVLHILSPESRQFYSLEKLWTKTQSNRKNT